MKDVLIITAAFLLLLLATSFAFAFAFAFAQGAGNEWDILNQEVMELYRTGKYDGAVVERNKRQKGQGRTPRRPLK